MYVYHVFHSPQGELAARDAMRRSSRGTARWKTALCVAWTLVLLACAQWGTADGGESMPLIGEMVVTATRMRAGTDVASQDRIAELGSMTVTARREDFGSDPAHVRIVAADAPRAWAVEGEAMAASVANAR